MRVIVKAKNKSFYECMQVPHGFKCGKCHHGIVFPKKHSTCKVCGSKVAQAISDNEFILPEP